MAGGRITKPPIIRNLELYHEIVCENKTQAQVAAEFEISQPRVAAVQRRVHRCVETLVSQSLAQSPPGLPIDKLRPSAGQKFHLAIVIRRLDLEQAYGKFLREFGGVTIAMAFIPILAEWDAGNVPEMVANLLPPRETIRRAIQMVAEINDLECLAERGPYPNLLQQLRQSSSSTFQPALPPPDPAPDLTLAPTPV